MRVRTKFYIILVLLGLIIIGMFLSCFYIQKHFFPARYRPIIRKYATEYDLDTLLVAAIVYRESRFDPNAVSKKSARGLMQIMPGTGDDIAEKLDVKDFSVEDLFEPELNLRFGCYYFAGRMKEFDSDIILALAAYNSGPENVREWLMESGNSSENLSEKYTFTETRNYVINVRKLWWLLKLSNKLISI